MNRNVSLYLVPTPIGNLRDITLRALDVLREVDLILTEDTRTSGVLLAHHGIRKPLQSYHIHNEHQAIARFTRRMEAGESFALISDAGTPGISDPGFLLVRACLAAGLKVECLPGPTALVPALVQSGFPCDRFAFEGFLPHKKGRLTALKRLSEEERTVVFYESPHRLIKTLESLAELLDPNRRISVSRELTKIHEESVTGTVAEVLIHFKKQDVKGEIVIVVDGKKSE